MKSEYASYHEGKVHYTVEGNGNAVVLLHGFLESEQMWHSYIPGLAKGKKIIAVDLPGHGETDCFGYIHSMELMAEAVKTVLKEQGIRKATLVGHSMGGYVALAFAEKYPDMVKGICMFFSTSHADSDEKKRNRDQAIKIVKKDHKGFIRKSIPLLFRPKNRKLYREDINTLKKKALKTPKQGVIAALEGMKTRIDREVILRFAPYPIHYIIGKWDPVLDHQKLIAQTRHGEHITYTLFEDIGHMGFIEEFNGCFKDLRKFINTCN